VAARYRMRSEASRRRRLGRVGILWVAGVLPLAPAGAGDPPIFADDFETGKVCRWSDAVGADPCPEPFAIDFCRLQFPLAVTDFGGAQVVVYGRLYVEGLTDQSGVNDPDPLVIGAVGYGPDGANPANGGWVWTDGIPNPGYGVGSPDYEAANDEYQATLTVPLAEGPFDFAFRFSGDGGATFTHCDDNGSTDGYQPAEAGQGASLGEP
jgi:hypothetical protein